MTLVRRLAGGAAIGGGAMLAVALLDVMFARVTFTHPSDRWLFVATVGFVLTAFGVIAGAALGIAWPFVRSRWRLAALGTIVTFPLGVALFSGPKIARFVPPVLGGAVVALIVGAVIVFVARIARPHVVWALVGVFFYLIDAWAWRPLYPAAHLILAGGYGASFALAALGLAKYFSIRLDGNRWLAPGCAIVVIGAGACLLALRNHNAVRFATIERTNGARKLTFFLAPLANSADGAASATQGNPQNDMAATAQSPLDNVGLLKGANLLLVTVDALRTDRVTASRGARKIMPFLSHLSEQSIWFDRAYAQAPHSAYSLASLMTSDYVHATLSLRTRAVPTLAEILRSRGYQTKALYTTGVFFTGQHKLNAFSQAHFGFDDASVMELDAGETTATALEAIEDFRRSQQPFFIWAHYFDAHEPYQPRPAFPYGSGAFATYDAEVSTVDAALPRLFDKLRTLERPTIVVVTSDHGEEFGEHGGAYHGSSLYDEQVRVPLLIAAPGLAPQRISQPVELVDVAPTVLALLDSETPPTMLGDNLAAAMRGRPWARPAFAEVDTMKMVVNGSHKLIHDWRRHTWELYDLDKDPHERTNIFDDEPQTAASLRGELFAWLDRLQHVVAADGQSRPRAIDLGRMGDLRAVGGLTQLLTDASVSDDTRIESARLLGRLQDKSAVDALWNASRNRGLSERVRAETAIALGELFDKRAVDTLAVLIGNSDAAMRVRAGIALAKLGDRRAAAVLADGVDHTDPELRLRSVRYLGWVGGTEQIPAVFTATKDLRLRAQACLTLGRIGGREPGARSVVRPFLIDEVNDEKYADIRATATVGLGYLGDPFAIDAVRKRLLESPPDGELRFAAETLIRLGAVERGAIGGTDVGPRVRAKAKGLIACNSRTSHDIEDFLGVTTCEADSAVMLPIAHPVGPIKAVLIRAQPLNGSASGANVQVEVDGHRVSFTLAPGWMEYWLPLPSPVSPTPQAAMHLAVQGDGARWAIDHALLLPN